MILQGTDGLSRGVDMQQLSSNNGNSLIPLLWQPAPATNQILQWVISILPPLFDVSTPWIILSDFSNWSRTTFVGRSVMWCISPNFARQAILQALAAWVESPTDSGHIFIVPRILQRDFGRLSKFVVYGGQYTNLPLPFTPLLPFVVYFLPPFDRHSAYQRQIVSPMDASPNAVPSWVQQEINGLLRLSAPS